MVPPAVTLCSQQTLARLNRAKCASCANPVDTGRTFDYRNLRIANAHIRGYKTKVARKAILLACSEEEASRIRERATEESRLIRAYVLRIVMRNVQIDEGFFAKYHRLGPLRGNRPKPKPRTVVLIRCSEEESVRIRTAAARRDSTISGYILHCLRRSWHGRGALPALPADADLAQTNKPASNARP
jgi:hypothetical protein